MAVVSCACFFYGLSEPLPGFSSLKNSPLAVGSLNLACEVFKVSFYPKKRPVARTEKQIVSRWKILGRIGIQH